jgi:hypothetical protein
VVKTVSGYVVTTIINNSQNSVVERVFMHPDFAWCSYDMEQLVALPDEEGENG